MTHDKQNCSCSYCSSDLDSNVGDEVDSGDSRRAIRSMGSLHQLILDEIIIAGDTIDSRIARRLTRETGTIVTSDEVQEVRRQLSIV
jgi:hypothetical protein